MRRFWDARAREDPFFFVDNRLAYRDPDMDRFWAGGEELLDAGLVRVGAELTESDDVVEIGCGVGRITRALATRVRSVRAIDVSAEMLSRAQDLNPHVDSVDWILGDGESLIRIETGSVDVCYSDVVFQHIPDPEVTLSYVRETGRVLRPGGWALFQISNDPAIHSPPSRPVRAGHLARELLGRAPRGQTHPAWLGSPMDLALLRRTADEAELTTERVVGEGAQFCHVLLRRRGDLD